MKSFANLGTWGQALGAMTVSLVLLASCKTETVLQNVVSFDTTMPVFAGAKALTATQVAFDFSVPVSATAVNFDPPAAIDHIEQGQRVLVTLKEPLPEGSRVMADLLVSDGKGNTLSVLTPFRARNDRMPSLVINEIRTEYSKPKVEYIEVYTKSAGNLGALSVVVALDGIEKPLYEFPPIEVSQGEYILLHLRTLEEACVDELAGDLALSGGTEAAPLARDLWISGSEERLRKTDGIALVNQDGMVLDAVLFSEYSSGDWLKEELVQFSSLLANTGAWTRRDQQAGAPQPQDAAMSGTATTTRTICRDEGSSDTNSAADWYVTVTSGATPGLPNRTERYTETAKTVRSVKKKK